MSIATTSCYIMEALVAASESVDLFTLWLGESHGFCLVTFANENGEDLVDRVSAIFYEPPRTHRLLPDISHRLRRLSVLKA